MSQASATDDAEDERTHNDEQLLPQKDVVQPIEEENINVEPLAELPSGISNAGPSRPSGLLVQQNTSNVSLVSDLATEAKKVVPEKDDIRKPAGKRFL
ncbi:uncharacterized protein F5891DRAFT_1182635 [Suillus fuscotomentosus]|uniref:Uncharacterized protein n=1 Tax=Suillus fuscotomentosus TaxID=1912939 RepID=A0AAD4EHS1_9AGAM|nr:uncharacterized protein F5891DRAFT_1182635 [Suillus fuscotomentosus]KAG1906380.1 hypothetical protein F5891DRAFT_1182635 [Suillus fuscotomentosus]